MNQGGRPLKPYVEIQRNPAAPPAKKPLSITVETVPTGETKILEVLEEVYNIPVDVKSTGGKQVGVTDANFIVASFFTADRFI